MKKEQDKNQQEQIEKLGTEYLNNHFAFILGYTDDAKGLEFSKQLRQVVTSDEQLEAVFEQYTYIAVLMSCFFDVSTDRIDIFEKKSLQLNSIISTSLNVEQHIHDLTYNKDLLLRQQLHEYSDVEYLKKLLEKITNTKELAKQKDAPQDLKEEIDDIQSRVKTMVNILEEQNKKTAKQIEDAKKNEYFIMKLNNDNSFIAFLESVYKQYIINELATNVAKDIYKKYGVKPVNQYKALKEKKNQCLTISSYPFITHRIAKLLELSLLNGNVANITIALSKYISLEEETATAEYKKLLEKYVKKADKELVKVTSIDDLASEVDSYLENLAKKMLQELRWCEID